MSRKILKLTGMLIIAAIATTACSGQTTEQTPAPASTAAQVITQETQTVTVSPAPTPDLISRPQVWFCPLPPMRKHSGRNFIGSDDYMDLFTEGAAWDEAAARVRVFELYGEWVSETATNEQLRQVIGDLNRRGIAIAYQTGPLNSTDTYGGIEGFSGVEQGLRMANRIKEAGGTVSYVDFDEPFGFASLYDSPKSPHWTAERVALEVGSFVNTIKTVFPDARFGSSEPLWNTDMKVEDLENWIDAYKEATGSPLAFLHLDVDYSRPGWEQDAKELEDFCRLRGVDFGIYYLGDSQDPTDEAWIMHAGEKIKDYELVTGGNPDHVLFASWHDRPDKVLPDTGPYTFTGFINQYFTDKSNLGIRTAGAGANLAYRKKVKASKSLSDYPAANAVDGFSGNWWGAGGPDPQWIEIDLGEPSVIAEVRLSVCQDPAGETIHRIRVKGPGTDNKFEVLYTFKGVTSDSDLLTYKLPQPKQGIRYIRIDTQESPSWVAWREIEVIGG